MIIGPRRGKDRLRQGQHALRFAAWGCGGSDHLERLAPMQPDSVWLEGERGDVSFAELVNLTRAIDLIGATPFIRVHQNERANQPPDLSPSTGPFFRELYTTLSNRS